MGEGCRFVGVVCATAGLRRGVASMARTVLDRGITGACSICWLIALFVGVLSSQLMTSFKLKSEVRCRRGLMRGSARARAPRGCPAANELGGDARVPRAPAARAGEREGEGVDT